jgi:hypothetical protein
METRPTKIEIAFPRESFAATRFQQVCIGFLLGRKITYPTYKI